MWLMHAVSKLIKLTILVRHMNKNQCSALEHHLTTKNVMASKLTLDSASYSTKTVRDIVMRQLKCYVFYTILQAILCKCTNYITV